MFIGHSSSRGIVIGDTAIKGDNAVYGCWRDGEISLETGSYKELVKRQNQEAEPDDKPSSDRNTIRKVFGVMGLFLAFSAVVWVLFGFVNFLAALVFSVLAYFPVMVILYARQNYYKSEELHQQFRRFHGCEHACVKLLSKHHEEEDSQPTGEQDVSSAGCNAENGTNCTGDDSQLSWLTMSNLAESPIYDSECGTVYAGYFLTLAVEIGLFLSKAVEIGFLKSVGVIVMTLILIVILVFMPWNPYKKLQYPAVAQPTEKEYELGLEVIKRFCSTIS